MNKVQLIGNLTTTPEPHTTSTGKTVVNFGVAVNRPTADRTADFIQCVAWNKTAENMVKYLDKGSKVGIEGRLQTRSYTHKNGYKVYVTEVVVERLEFLNRVKKDSAPLINQPQTHPTQYNPTTPQNTQNTNNQQLTSEPEENWWFESVSDDDLPF